MEEAYVTLPVIPGQLVWGLLTYFVTLGGGGGGGEFPKKKGKMLFNGPRRQKRRVTKKLSQKTSN